MELLTVLITDDDAPSFCSKLLQLFLLAPFHKLRGQSGSNLLYIQAMKRQTNRPMEIAVKVILMQIRVVMITVTTI